MDADICLMEPNKRVQMVEARQQPKKRSRMDGPDGGWAWCVALSACSINFIMAGLGRMSGILYVAFIEQFEVSRKTATAPFSIRSSTRNLLGPVVGILGQQFSVRTVSIAGGIVGTISSALCYFATDMDWITILWGGFNGIGSAMTMTLAQVVIGQHFVTHRTTASGLAFSGGCVGSFLFPVLIEYLLQNYGLQGTFLILSGVVMHVIPAAMMLRKPSWMKNGSRQSSEIHEESRYKDAPAENQKQNAVFKNSDIPEQPFPVDNNAVDGFIREESLQERFFWFEQDLNFVAQIIFSKIRFTENSIEAETENSVSDKLIVLDNLRYMYSVAKNQLQNDSTADSEDLLRSRKKTCQISREFIEFVENLNNFAEADVWKNLQLSQESTYHKQITVQILREVDDVYNLYLKAKPSRSSASDMVKVPVADKNGFSVSKTWMESLKSHIKTSITLNANPMYILICLCRAIHFITYIPVVTVIVDFCMDKGLPEEDGKFAIAALSAGDLVGRLCFGWITDKRYINLPRYMFFNMIIQGVSTAALPMMPNRWSLMGMFSIFGMLEGSLFIRHPVLISNYMKEDQQSIAMGSMNFLSGLIGLSLPYIIGYFRDTLGSYDMMFYINAAIGFVIGIVWLFEPYFAKCAAGSNLPMGSAATV